MFCTLSLFSHKYISIYLKVRFWAVKNKTFKNINFDKYLQRHNTFFSYAIIILIKCIKKVQSSKIASDHSY